MGSSVTKVKQNAAGPGGGTETPTKRHSDKELFGSGHESYLGVSPICILPLPLDPSHRGTMTCCMKEICDGCSVALAKADAKAGRYELVCAFCRAPVPEEGPDGYAMSVARVKKRVEAGDAVAMRRMGECHIRGQKGVPRNAAKGI